MQRAEDVVPAVLKVARDLELAPLLLNELLNFQLKVNVQTGHDSYEAWRESIPDDLVLPVALACWQATHRREAGALYASKPAPTEEPSGLLYYNPRCRREDDPLETLRLLRR